MDDKEKLALLGFSDPKHSLAWYRERNKDLPKILEQFIVDSLSNYGTFPSDVKNMEKDLLYHKYYLIIEYELGKYLVKINNTDRREVSEKHVFDNANTAAKFLIKKSYTAGGAISQYWDCSEGE